MRLSCANTWAGSTMLELRGLKSGYGRFEVLHDVDLEVGDNEIVALLGHNGAGKSTLLRATYGLLPAWGGHVLFNGRDPTQSPAEAGIRYVPQEGNVFPNLSVRENLRLGAYSSSPDADSLARQVEQVVELFPALKERLRVPARVLSGGQRQMLAISMGLMTAPRLLLLDEPSAGLGPVLVQRLFDTIAEMRDRLG